ncbi:MAG: DUF6448 family protein [Desulfuromonadales bacterium]|nr:DUF6448 family protein [Desulfuromonadales bacterium]
MKNLRTPWIMPLLIVAGLLLLPQLALAHCDTLDGPVVIDARTALQARDVTPVLKWLRANDEPEIRAAFKQTLAVRTLGGEAQELADHYFFETLVRVHRAGEGAPYTGLKAAGMVEPPIAKADLALEKGSVDELAKSIAAHTEKGIREKFAAALQNRKHAADSVAAGRAFVESYVTYVHYVEGIVNAVHAGAHHGQPAPSAAGHQH